MKFQTGIGTCGPAALQNFYRCYRKKFKQSKIAKECNCSKRGTTPIGMISSLHHHGFSIAEIDLDSRLSAFERLDSHLRGGRPAILVVQNHQHWAIVIGKVANNYICIDSGWTHKNQMENGIIIRSVSELCKWWRGKTDKTAYYAILPSKRRRSLGNKAKVS